MPIQYISRDAQKNLLNLTRDAGLDVEKVVATGEVVSAAIEYVRKQLVEKKLKVEVLGVVQGKPVINFIEVASE